MPAPSPTPDQIATSFAQAIRIRAEIARKEAAIRRRTQTVARGLAVLMGPGAHFHRRGMGLHAFDVDGDVGLAAAFLEEKAGDYLYRFAVLCGGEAASRTLRTAPLDPGDSDEPGTTRRIALASYLECEGFLERLPIFIGDLTRLLGARLDSTRKAEAQVDQGRRALATIKRLQAQR